MAPICRWQRRDWLRSQALYACFTNSAALTGILPSAYLFSPNPLTRGFEFRLAHKNKAPTRGALFYGASGGTRTHCPQFRKLLLYPDELRRRHLFYTRKLSVWQEPIFAKNEFVYQQSDLPNPSPRILPRHAFHRRCQSA